MFLAATAGAIRAAEVKDHPLVSRFAGSGVLESSVVEFDEYPLVTGPHRNGKFSKIEKVEGNVTFHTAMSTAFPQPAPGTAPSPGPMKVPAEKLRSMLGLTSVQYLQGKTDLAVVDSNLS